MGWIMHEFNHINTVMQSYKKIIFVLSFCLIFSLWQGQAEQVFPDTTSRSVAIQRGKDEDKMVLLIITDTNICTACVTLETILPSVEPPVRDFLAESFIYWGCGGQYSAQCNSDYKIYTGTGTIGIPSIFVIDPYKAQTSQNNLVGVSTAERFYSWLSKSLLTSTSPRITNLSSNQTINNSNFVAQGRSISTNVPIKTVKYSLNGLGWISLPVSTINNPSYGFQIPLAPKIGANQLRVYAIDSTGAYKSKTNVLNFNYNPNNTPVTPDITVGGGNLSLNIPGSGSYVVQASTNPANPNGWIDICTNTAPFTFTDTNAVNQYPKRFYRTKMR
jgi:hypothetical protein